MLSQAMQELIETTRDHALAYRVKAKCKLTEPKAPKAMPLRIKNRRLRATLSAITATDCYSRDECAALARAALKPEGWKWLGISFPKASIA